MASPLKQDCKIWAKKKAQSLRRSGHQDIKFLRITPKNGARHVGPYTLNDGTVYDAGSDPGAGLWAHHYAVISNGQVMDEVYKNGLPEPVYRQLFAYHSDLNFDVVPKI